MSYKNVIAISGSHGKTTTTAMISEMFFNANLSPTVQIGGVDNLFKSNYRIGNKKFFIVEACEYMDNFLQLKPDVSIILNIDSDHLDYFKNLDGVKKSFFNFAKNTKDGGLVVSTFDDKNSKDVSILENSATFGFSKKNDITAKNIREYQDGKYSFDVFYLENNLGNIKLNLFGKHNILNALCTILVGIIFEIDFCDIKFSLENFSGVERRCQFVGEYNGANIFHDYAHHPSQIKTMIEIAKKLVKKSNGKIITIFEPHTYSRTKYLLEDFAKSFSGSDYVIFLPVYSARENESDGCNSIELSKITENYVKNVEYFSTFSDAKKYTYSLLCEGDVVLILGAGTIENFSKSFLLKNNF